MLDRSTTQRLAEIYEGLPVLGLLPGSPAALAGVRAGDIVLSVNGMRTPDVDSYVSAKGWMKGVMIVRVVRGGEELELTLAEPKHPVVATPEVLASFIADSDVPRLMMQPKHTDEELN